MILTFCSCQQDPMPKTYLLDDSCIQRLDGNDIGLSFRNRITETEDVNIMNYEYLYNGGGVGVADFDNDGFQDIVFTGSQVDDMLFKNDGYGKFLDVTAKSGIIGKSKFSTGVTICDINNDGYSDIYISKTGKGAPDERQNELWVNNGDFTFSESANEYGIGSQSHSNHAAFLDIDLDGDLDLYVMNHPIDFKNSQKLRIEFRNGEYVKNNNPKTSFDSDQLFLNTNNRFVDVTAKYGISNYGYGLSVSIADVNTDGYPDIFISNDYIEPDKLYINQKGKGFKDEVEKYFSHLSENSMGSIFDDFDNDGDQDLVVVDMVSDDLVRQKQLVSSMTHSRYKYLQKVGYHPQHMRNVLQINTGMGKFSEAAQSLGVSNTDWSWTPLFIDFDNNGFRDLFISNGYYRDLTDCDYTNYKSDSLTKANITSIKSFVTHIPQTPVNNSIFMNNDGKSFNNKVNVCNQAESFSNGAAYIDIDNDGKLEVIVNNIDSSAYIYRYQSESEGRFVTIHLIGNDQNKDAFGSRIEILAKNQYQEKHLQSTDGYFSSSDSRVHFGLGSVELDSVDIKITWPDQSYSKTKVSLDKETTISYNNIERQKWAPIANVETNESQLMQITQFEHIENEFDDLTYDHIMPHCFSNLGPTISIADIDKSGVSDMFFGASIGSNSSVLMNGKNKIEFTDSQLREDVESLFYDLDNDGDDDLIVGFSDNQSKPSLESYGVSIYENVDGKLASIGKQLTNRPISVGSISVGDFDIDGLPDLFIGAYVSIREYPKVPKSMILQNKGDLEFSDISSKVDVSLIEAGMVTDSKYIDYDNDGKSELIVCGEFMPIMIFDVKDGIFERKRVNGLEESNGWWRSIHVVDVNQDGHNDIVGGNYGNNHRYITSENEPYTVFHSDFDQNGTYDAIPSRYHNGELTPILQRGDLLKELALLQRILKDYSTYSTMSTSDLLKSMGAKEYGKHEVFDFNSAVFFGEKSNGFIRENLPSEYQRSNIYAINSKVSDNGEVILFLGGNNTCTNVEYGPFDAGYNYILKYKNDKFQELNNKSNSTFEEIRKIELDEISGQIYYGINGVGVKTLLFSESSN